MHFEAGVQDFLNKFPGVTTKYAGHIATWSDFVNKGVLSDVLEHIYKGDVGASGGRGAHVESAIDNITTRIKPGKTLADYSLTPEGFRVGVELEMFNKAAYDQHLDAIKNWASKKPRTPDEKFIFGGKEFDQNPNNWNMDQYWIAKDNATTLYPSTWDANTIELKISEAWKNGVKEVSDPLDSSKKALRGLTDEGIPLQFSIENLPPSVFANFNIATWK